MVNKKHTRNQKRMYRIHKMEEQIEKDKYIIGNQQQELERYKNIVDKAIEYMNNYNELVVPDANIKSLILKEEYKKIIDILQGSNE